jgi:tripeptide aminopeptidase
VIRPAVPGAAAALAAGLFAAAAAAQTLRCDAAADAACAEVARLAADPRVERALRFIVEDDARTVRDLIALTEVPAPPFQEEERGRVYAEWLAAAGADSVWTDSVGNVLALRRGAGGGPTLVVSGHLDTVFPPDTPIRVRIAGDTLFAPGVGDDTRGLIAVLVMLRALEAAAVPTLGDLLFVGTVGEEGLGDLRGVKHLFREGGPRIDAFISVDGSDDSGITHQALGSRRYRVVFHGPGGHSWGAFGIANPAHALGHAIRRFDEDAAALVAQGPRTSYNVGRIGGGTSVNSVPFSAWMEVDMRSVSQPRLMSIDSLFHRAMRQSLDAYNARGHRGERLELEIELVGDRPSGQTPADHPLVRHAIAVTRHLGLEPVLGIGSTDSNVPISIGIPAITIGGGGTGGDAHALTEWWANVNGPRGIQRALLIALGVVGVAP